ncbi:uncharacterized protein LOC124928158 [Impatiens glandulifera]|uniref:uncharacterized protein LOC124928158 n=1 Tax=Impatiens glandulifera TaxID=253017 RepID=UPI001FB0E7EF|nr:uncharacterized protein LOC124928158 [Impatiens glandulifera]
MASLITPSTSNVDTSSTTITDQTSSSSNSANNFHLLEITLISAQDLAFSRSMRTYSVVSIQPDHKLNTRIDSKGRTNPTWNDKFMFRVDNDFLNSESSTINVDIYNTSWLRDTLIGNVRIGISDLIPPSAYQVRYNNGNIFNRFVALQIRRPSGNPQGIMNMAVTLFPFGPPVYRPKDNVPPMSRRMEIQDDGDAELEQEKCRLNEKINLWRSPSEDLDYYDEGYYYNGSIINGSACNGSMVNSDVGPSASIVAEAIATGTYQAPTMGGGKRIEMDDGGSSIVGDLTKDEANARGYRTRTKRWPGESEDGSHVVVSKNHHGGSGRHSRRHSDVGLFSCFALGLEFTIVCGSNDNENGRQSVKKRTGGGENKALNRHHSQREQQQEQSTL